jgi:hypothetical protein
VTIPTNTTVTTTSSTSAGDEQTTQSLNNNSNSITNNNNKLISLKQDNGKINCLKLIENDASDVNGEQHLSSSNEFLFDNETGSTNNNNSAINKQQQVNQTLDNLNLNKFRTETCI